MGPVLAIAVGPNQTINPNSHPDARVIRLERNFRSRQPVLDLANNIRPSDEDSIQLHSDRAGGSKPQLVRCYDAPSEARAVANQILEAHQRGVQLRQRAILVRAAHHSDLIEVELSVRKVPYRKYGGLRFLEAAHVKDFVAAARLLENCHDEVAWYRVFRLHRNIGPSRARDLIRVVSTLACDALSGWPEIVAASPSATRTALSASLGGLFEARQRSTPGARAEAVLEALRPLLRDRYGDSSARLEDLDRLVGAASVVDDFSAWLADLTLDPPTSTGALAGEPHLDEDYVVISTIHSAKGLEWSIVHLPHMVDGAMPSDMALKSDDGLQEEHRLLYVAVTRARDELCLYAPLRMPHHRHARDDRHSFAPLSRFLDDQACTALEVIDERQRQFNVSGTTSERVVVDLDALWA